TFVATNTGNTRLTDVRIEETEFTGSGSMSALDCTPGQPAVLLPRQTHECEATYRVTQADVHRGSLANTAQVTGSTPARPVTEADGVDVRGDPKPAMTLGKRLGRIVDTNGDGRLNAGEKVHLEFEVANGGNVTLSGIQIDDRLLADAGVAVT